MLTALAGGFPESDVGVHEHSQPTLYGIALPPLCKKHLDLMKDKIYLRSSCFSQFNTLTPATQKVNGVMSFLEVGVMADAINFIAQIFDIKARRNNGGKIVLEVGEDAIPQMQQLMALLAQGDISIGVAMVPVKPMRQSKDTNDWRDNVDPLTGEIGFDPTE